MRESCWGPRGRPRRTSVQVEIRRRAGGQEQSGASRHPCRSYSARSLPTFGLNWFTCCRPWEAGGQVSVQHAAFWCRASKPELPAGTGRRLTDQQRPRFAREPNATQPLNPHELAAAVAVARVPLAGSTTPPAAGRPRADRDRRRSRVGEEGGGRGRGEPAALRGPQHPNLDNFVQAPPSTGNPSLSGSSRHPELNHRSQRSAFRPTTRWSTAAGQAID